ncbi:MAG: hypothetical protein FJZ90_13595, partial [Chloroflexi bacterium]|nr:hypothetical protein [Chloroflexota bacterium]
MPPQPKRPTTLYVTMGTHCDLFWMGTHLECLDWGARIQRHALELMEQHSDYCYYIETTIFADHHLRKHPEDKARMVRLLQSGQLEIGACFVDRVEHVHSGESIIRHAVEGVRWLEETFGPDARTACHPDLPGLSPQIPQIYAKAGIQCYFHARGYGSLHDWYAPDGSHILYSSLYGYGEKSPDALRSILSSPQPTEVVFTRGGYGDLRDASDRILDILSELRREFPDVAIRLASPRTVLDDLWRGPLPRLSGEVPYGWASLGSGFVRLMDQSVRLEHALLTAEKLVGIARGLGVAVAPSPEAEASGPSARWLSRHKLRDDVFGEPIPPGSELRELWRYELVCQDHNYGGRHGAQSNFDKEIMRDHALAETNRWVDGALAALAPGGQGERLVAFNPLSWPRDEVVVIPDEHPETLRVADAQGTVLPSQPTQGGLAVQMKALPPLGLATYTLSRGEPTSANGLPDNRLPSEHLDVDLDVACGRIARLYDRAAGRDLLDHEGRGFCELISLKDDGVDVRYGPPGEVESDALCGYQPVLREDGPVYARLVVA